MYIKKGKAIIKKKRKVKIKNVRTNQECKSLKKVARKTIDRQYKNIIKSAYICKYK